jgi:chemotaxis protein methyltransferase CheR
MAIERVDIGDDDVDGILEVIYKSYGYDFFNYSRASLIRRLNRFMEDAAIRNTFDLKYLLTNDRNTFELFLQRVTVNVTEMFRDPEFYAVIKEKVIPVIATYPIIKIWHAGCSSGEEVFSIAILLHEAGLLNRSRIYATDINPSNIEKAKKGIVPLEVMKDYVSNYIKAGGQQDFASYYTARYNNAIISKELRKNILFSQHNLVTDQVFNEFQLIFCRNVMIYFNRELQNKVIRLFYDSLATLGYLAIGIKESLIFSDMRDYFEEVSRHEKIYRKIR